MLPKSIAGRKGFKIETLKNTTKKIGNPDNTDS